MTLSTVRATGFRCFAEAELDVDPLANLIVGPNAAGKTSLLEAVAYLGRGKSFRGASTQQVVRHGEQQFVVFGRVSDGRRDRQVGVQNGRDGLEIRIDGERQVGVAALAELLPLQIVDPEVHELVAGGPERRRRYLDWILFHVEHRYLETWRRFRRALKQRNAALKLPQAPGLSGWDREFAEASEALTAQRRAALESAIPTLERMAGRLLGAAAGFEFRQGWPEEADLGDVLAAGRERDQAQGSTQQGPHRADIRLRYDDRMAKRLVSRGQQKLLACSLILAAAAIVQDALGRPLLLLLDDPAAELDSSSLAGLLDVVRELGCQVIATALTAEPALITEQTRMFHVEQGQVRNA